MTCNKNGNFGKKNYFYPKSSNRLYQTKNASILSKLSIPNSKQLQI